MKKLKMKIKNNSMRILLGIIIFSCLFILLLGCGAEITSPDDYNVPTNLEIEKVAEGRIKLTWNYLSNIDDTLYFVIARKIGEQNWNENYGSIPSDNPRIFYDDISTTDSTIYAYKIRVHNIEMDEYSSFSEAVAYFSELTTPSDLTIQQVSQNKVRLTWQDHCVGEEGYRIDKKVKNGDWINKYKLLNANTTSFEDETTLFSTHSYRITAYLGNSSSNAIIDSILPTLIAPSELTLTKLDPHKIKLSWQDNSEEEQGFYIDRKIGDQEWVAPYDSVASNTTLWIDDIEFPCGTFAYRVRAFNNSFSSPYSNVVQTNVFLEKISFIETPGNAIDVHLKDWYAFVADSYEGLNIINWENPNNPQQLTSLPLPDRTLSVYVKSNLAYVLNHTGGFNLLDISLPENPTIIGSCSISPGGVPYDVCGDENYAYIANGNEGLAIITTTGPPHQAASISTQGEARAVTVQGNYAFIANGLNGGVTIIDVADPLNPEFVSSLPITGLANDIYVSGNYCYIANGESGIALVNIANPNNPELLAETSTKGFACGIHPKDNYIYIADKERGLVVVDASDPRHPYVLGFLELSSPPNSIYVSGSYAVITDDDGLNIIQIIQ